MKKLDFVLITIIVLIIAFFSYTYFDKLFINTKKATIVLMYKNYELARLDYTPDLDIVYEIEIKEDNNTLLIITIHHNDVETIHYLTVKEDRAIYNRIHFLYQDIHVEEANCANKVCMRSKMSSMYTLPITCTNGIIVMFEQTSNTIDGPIVP